MPLLELKILEIHSFPHYFLHALTYWAEILHMTLFYCTTDQVRVLLILRQFLWELCPFWNLEYWKYTVFHSFLLHALTYGAESLHMTLFYCTTDQVRVSLIYVNFCRSYGPFGTKNIGIQTLQSFHIIQLKVGSKLRFQ